MKGISTYRVMALATLACVSVFVILVSVPAVAQEAVNAMPAEIPYDVSFSGLPTPELEADIKEASQLLRLKDSPPASILGLRRRIRADVQRFTEIMKSQGYYGSRVTMDMNRPGTQEAVQNDNVARASTTKTQVAIQVLPGPRYNFAPPVVSLTTPLSVENTGYQLPLDILAGQPALASEVIDAEHRAIQMLANAGYPFAKILPRRAEVDHGRSTIAVFVNIDPGLYHSFGRIVFSGLQTVEEIYLTRLLPWVQGVPFDLSKLAAYRQSLIDTRLFTSVKVEPVTASAVPGGQSVDTSGKPLDILVTVEQGALRTIGTSLSYARDEGFGGSVTWQHRNIFGQGETLDLLTEVTELNQLASASLTKPAFRRPDQVLKTGLSLLHEDSDAFEEYSATVQAGVTRDLWSSWRAGVGVSVEAAELTDAFGTQQSYLLGLPLSLTRDQTDSLLDPKRGYRLGFEVTPYAGEFGGTALFTRASATGTYYYPWSDDVRPVVLAARLKVGSVIGEQSQNVPANKRFYSGGGGSVRGFGYQLLGALDADNDPIGGRSVIETGLEARVPVTDALSVVPFVDGGLVSPSVTPSLSEKFRVGAGLGVRYATPVGPLRLDVAIPVNRRKAVDSSFQFYISFGQAF
ncbi:MAG: autotransporter assembly complex family protein [Rhodospirillaceae bacterium]